MSTKASQPEGGYVKSGPYGGYGEYFFQELSDEIGVRLLSIQAWEGIYNDAFVVLGLRLTWSDGRSSMVGRQHGPSTIYSFDEDEKIQSMKISASRGVDDIYFETGQGFLQAGGTGGTEYPFYTGSGELVGFDGYCTEYIDSITTYVEGHDVEQETEYFF